MSIFSKLLAIFSHINLCLQDKYRRTAILYRKQDFVAAAQQLTAGREGVLATFKQLQTGFQPNIGAVLPLAQAAEAHRVLEAGETTGSILLRH